MPKARNILKTGLLIIALLLSAMVRYAHAQVENTGASPYLDSRHAYRIIIDSVANTQQWIITDGVTPYILSDGSCTWATYEPATTNGGYDVVHITFDHTVFTTGTWSLQYRETDRNHSCVSAREFPIDVVPNTFYLTLADDIDNICNSQSDSSHLYSEVDVESFLTQVTYTVTMNKDDDFDPTSWEFDAHFSQSATVDSIIASEGALTFTGSGADYHINVETAAANSSLVTVNLYVSYNNPVTADIIRNLDVLNGMAVYTKTDAPDATTEDNNTIYPVSLPGDRVQAITILAIPETRDIVFGAGETATTAANPLQNSTHRYLVEMDDLVANFATSGWYIDTLNGGTVPAVNYVITRSQSGDIDTATIAFHMGPGSYMLHFYETNASECTAVREFPFTLQEPFDVDIAHVDDICSSANEVIFSNLTDTTTEVTYTITLNMASYGSDWSFGFALTSDQTPDDFTLGDVDVAAIALTAASSANGVGYTGIDDYSGSVTVPSTVSTVQIVVTYAGYYQHQYGITATITPTGSFDEEDADAVDSAEHIIYSMPQITALVGVE